MDTRADDASHARAVELHAFEHELSEALSHHLDEEERDVLNPARTEVDLDVRTELGAEFAAERARLIDTECGSIENVRRVVAAIDKES